MDTTFEGAFWESFRQPKCRRKEEGGKILAILWAMWLHPNEVLLRGRKVSTDGVIQDAEGLMASWFYHN